MKPDRWRKNTTAENQTPEERLAALGLSLPAQMAPGGNYIRVRRDGQFLYVSGQGPRRPDGSRYVGKVGDNVSVEEAYEHAKLTGLAILSLAKAETGDLGAIEVIKMFGMVNAAPQFGDHAKVINGCSDLFTAVLGDRGRHARSAVGLGSLPGGMTVEIEVILRVRSD